MINFEDKMQKSVVVKMLKGFIRSSNFNGWHHAMTYFLQIDGLDYFETAIEGREETNWSVISLEERHKKAYDVANKAAALAWAINNKHCKRELKPVDSKLKESARHAASWKVYLDWEPPHEYSEQWFIEQNFPADLFKY